MKKLLQSLFILMLVASAALAQDRTVTGTVSAKEDGSALPGVSIQVKGTKVGTQTSTDGKFTIKVPQGSTDLVFTYIGFLPQTVKIGTATSLKIVLSEDANQLAEVVIQVPYGSTTKKAFTGAETTITNKDIQKRQVTSVTRVLEGLIPGVQTTSGGGAPGSGVSVLIRGVGSINASSSPLYVVDGVPYGGTISGISTDDIENVTVLKDAAASALYGSRAANGVIMITTKSGKSGTAKIDVSFRSGVSERAIPEYDRVSTPQFYELMWEAAKNRYIAAGQTTAAAITSGNGLFSGSSGVIYNAYSLPLSTLIDQSTGKVKSDARLIYQDNWSEALFQTAKRNDLNMNISGGNQNSDYIVSFGYIKEDGTAKFSGYDRINARLKVNSAVKSWLDVGLNVGAAISNSKGLFTGGTATSNPFYYSRYMGPIYPVWQRDANGGYVIDPLTGQQKLDWGVASQMGARPYAGNSNLLGTLAMDERSLRRTEGSVNTFLNVKFLKDFSFKTTFGGNYYNALETAYQNSQFGDAANVTGRSTKGNNASFTYTFNQVLSWKKSFGGHNFAVLAGHENYSYDLRAVSTTRTGFPFPLLPELASAATITGSSSSLDLHKIESYFSQLNYNYKDKYLLSGSIRRDGSSRFQVDNRWGNFWSVGGAWRLSQEPFMKGFSWINELKLRASYGQQGNEDTNNYYSWQGLYSYGYNNGSLPGIIRSSIANPALEWEKNIASNIGFDAQLFGRVDLTAEYYERTSKDLLFDVPLAPSTGVSSITRNVGTMKNSGIELQLGYNAVKSKNFDYRIDVNLSRYKNKITQLPLAEIVSGTKKLMVGQDIYAFWLREYAGVNPTNGDALYYQDVKDANGLVIGRTTVNNINNATFYYKGSAIPDLTGGINNSFRYKGFDFSFLTSFQVGGMFYDGNYAGLMQRGTNFGQHLHVDQLRRWQKAGDITDVPRLQTNITLQDGTSTRFLFDASYLSIKNVNFGYTVPKNVLKKLGISSLRAFVAADNLLLLTKKKGMDPQRAFNGTSDFTYPPFRTLTFGLNVNL
jgi:TonB-linked SusC/RagA family outer membrane protein